MGRKNRTPVNSAEAAGASPDRAWSDLILSEGKTGAPRLHFNLATRCSKPLRHQSDVKIPVGRAADLPWRGYGTEHLWGQGKFCPGTGWLGLATLPRDQGCKVMADLKEAARSRACSEVAQVTLLPEEIMYQGVDI